MDAYVNYARQAYLNDVAEKERKRLEEERRVEEETLYARNRILDLLISNGVMPEEFRGHASVNKDPVGKFQMLNNFNWTDFLVFVKYADYPLVRIEVKVVTGEEGPELKGISYTVYASDHGKDGFESFDLAFGYAAWLHDKRSGK